MSGIVGIFNLDGKPVDRGLLEAMAGVLSLRAPGGMGLWCADNIGLGHARLQVPGEVDIGQQPDTVNGRVWITADARIDGRRELLAVLRRTGREVPEGEIDARLILHAYDAFGQSCCDHLIGDYAFALWDSGEARMICSRDHFGVRPLYYARFERSFLFASDVACLLKHPAVSTRLDEEAVLDFLLFGEYLGEDQTIFQNIRALLPAHLVRVDKDLVRFTRYWTLPLDTEIRYTAESDYAERFQDLFVQAVQDRTRAAHVSLELSGGVDSTSVAALVAVNALSAGKTVQAYTTSYERLLPDDRESHYAAMVASQLGIPLIEEDVGNYLPLERFDEPEFRTDQPTADIDLALYGDRLLHMAKTGSCVLLSGFGGDEVFELSSLYFVNLLRSGRFGKFFTEVCQHVRHRRSLTGTGLGAAARGAPDLPDWLPALPDWLQTDFARRHGLRERWYAGWRSMRNEGATFPQLQGKFGVSFREYEMLRMPIVTRYPYFDLRLVTYLVGVPNFVKWEKRVLRQVMEGRLPEAVRVRPKTPLAGDYLRSRLGFQHLDPVRTTLPRAGAEYVDPGRYARYIERYLAGEGSASTWSSVLVSAPIALDHWLEQL